MNTLLLGLGIALLIVGAALFAADRVRRSRTGRPAASRRARRGWAAGRNAEYAKTDPGLAEQWQRVPVGEARDVVSGFAHGREMRLCDVGGVTVLALRRPVPSDVVLEFSRIGPTDLPEVGTEGGVLVSSTHPEVIHRVFDSRAHRMLRGLPESLTAAWAEGEWIIGAFEPGAGPVEWDAALAPLAAFGDIARRLPAAPGSVGELDPAHRDPTRPEPRPDKTGPGHLQPLADAGGDGPPAEPEEVPRWRPAETPAEPVELPTRSVPRRMGEGEFRDLGESDSGLPALGEDPGHTRSRLTGGRIIRPDPGPAMIFGDGDGAGDGEQVDDTDTENRE